MQQAEHQKASPRIIINTRKYPDGGIAYVVGLYNGDSFIKEHERLNNIEAVAGHVPELEQMSLEQFPEMPPEIHDLTGELFPPRGA